MAMMKRLLLACAAVLIPCQLLAQTTDALLTQTGHDVSGSVGSYTYTEPGTVDISMHGAKVGGEYAGTVMFSKRHHWFTQANVRGTVGNTTYDGWCSPWLIIPNGVSPNGYQLDLGDASPCSESGDSDWYVEARALVGKDFVGQRWGLSPHTGVGVRHLSNGTTGVAKYRTDEYLYMPFGLTTRTRIASNRTLSINLEYDRLLHGWQKTHGSKLGGGDVPATPTAPAFTIDGFSDVSFAQHDGWALRAGARFQLTTAWWVEPYYVHWSVGASPVNFETATFTVNQVTARQQLGFYEPDNTTNEFDVRVGFHF